MPHPLGVDQPSDGVAVVVGQRVAAALEAAGISRLDASKKTDIPRETFYRKCRGGSPFDVAELGRIAALLGCTVTDLVAEDVAA